MAHFALIDKQNIVTNVLVVPNDQEDTGKEYLNSIGLKGEWIQTSYNCNFRKNFAGIGYTYDEERDAFIPPKPYNSWILNEDTCLWEPPIPYPSDDIMYIWNENQKLWEEVINDN